MNPNDEMTKEHIDELEARLSAAVRRIEELTEELATVRVSHQQMVVDRTYLAP